MENLIIILIVAAAIILALSKVIKKRGTGCCGTAGDYMAKKKKLPNVKYQKIFVIEGMHCEKCKNRVEELVGDIEQAAAVVNLERGEALVSYAEDIDDELIRAQIEKGGYTVKEII